MENQIKVFNSPQFGNIRTTGSVDNPLFCLADVCKAVGLTTNGVSRRLQDDVISNHPICDSLGRTQQAIFVNEDGLYDVILDSRKPEARSFRKWITSDVLPSIRKTGGYIATTQEDTPELIMARALQVAQATIDRHKKQLEQANERIALQGEQLKSQAPKVDYYDKVLNSTSTMTTGQVAACFGMSAIALNKRLCAIDMQYKQSGMYFLKHPYSSYHLSDVRTYPYNKADGTVGTKQYLVWNERGKQFLVMLHQNDFDIKRTKQAISPDFWMMLLRPQCTSKKNK